MNKEIRAVLFLFLLVLVGWYVYIFLDAPLTTPVWWGLAILSFVFLDPITTHLAVQRDGLEEGMTIPRKLFGPNPSFLGIGAFHAVMLLALYLVVQLFGDQLWDHLVPVGIFVMGFSAAVSNLYLYRFGENPIEALRGLS